MNHKCDWELSSGHIEKIEIGKGHLDSSVEKPCNSWFGVVSLSQTLDIEILK